MNTFLINPVDRTITQSPVEGTIGYQEIKAALDDNWITHVQLRRDLSLWLDDEGLLKSGQHFFQLRGYPTPLAGKGFICGLTSDGNSVPLNEEQTAAIVSEVIPKIVWLGTEQDARAAIARGEVTQPVTTVNGQVVWKW